MIFYIIIKLKLSIHIVSTIFFLAYLLIIGFFFLYFIETFDLLKFLIKLKKKKEKKNFHLSHTITNKLVQYTKSQIYKTII